MMQPRRADVGAAMIADCTDHARLQVAECDVVGKTAGVDFSVVVAVRIAAADEHTVSPDAPHVGERHGLVVEQKVWDCPGHPQCLSRISGWASS